VSEGETVVSIPWGAINYWAVLVAGLATFLLGGLWYTALFGKLWVQLNGYTEEQVKKMQARRPPPVFFGGMVACYLIVALVFGILVATFNVPTALAGIGLGCLLWLAMAAISMTGHIASDKPLGLFVIDTSFQLIFLVMMGAILGSWR